MKAKIKENGHILPNISRENILKISIVSAKKNNYKNKYLNKIFKVRYKKNKISKIISKI
jgi:hypothetical protein